MNRFRSALDVAVGIVLIVAAAFVIRSAIAANAPVGAPPKLEGTVVSIGSSASMGEASAKVGMLIFSDFECPFCAQFAQETLPSLTERYVRTGQVRLVFRHFPLAMHKNAPLAARAVECARTEDRFWQLHDALFAHQRDLNPDNIPRLGRDIGLSGAWNACFEGSSPASADAVSRDLTEANALRIASTPTVLIGEIGPDILTVRTVIGGAKPLSDFVTAIERALKQ
jgi:protein-disulfide isomerase